MNRPQGRTRKRDHRRHGPSPLETAKHGALEHRVGGQFIDVAAVFVFCGVGSFIILAILKYTIGIRVSEDVEIEGLDINLHGEVVQG